jgi:hypothetical protein
MFNNSKIKIGIISGALLIGAFLLLQARKNHDVDTSTEAKPIQDFRQLPEQALAAAQKVTTEIPLIQPSSLNEQDQKKWETFKQLLQSRNDNDPRLDSEFKTFSKELHQAMIQEYQALPMEKRNERGLIGFLIARDLQSTEDLQFLKSIYEESPCLSLENCSSRAESDPHHSATDQVSQSYPQMAVLYQLEKQIQNGNKVLTDPATKALLKELSQRASQFQVPMVSQKAESIFGR